MCVCVYLRVDPAEDAVADGVTRRIKQVLGDLEPLSIHLLLLVNVDAHNVLVDAKEVHYRMVLVNKDVGAVRDPKHIRGGKVGSSELSIVGAPLHGLLVGLSGLVQCEGSVDGCIGDGCEGVLVTSVHHLRTRNSACTRGTLEIQMGNNKRGYLIFREAVDSDSKRNTKAVVAL